MRKESLLRAHVGRAAYHSCGRGRIEVAADGAEVATATRSQSDDDDDDGDDCDDCDGAVGADSKTGM
jgi:hypothetical protein